MTARLNLGRKWIRVVFGVIEQLLMCAAHPPALKNPGHNERRVGPFGFDQVKLYLYGNFLVGRKDDQDDDLAHPIYSVGGFQIQLHERCNPNVNSDKAHPLGPAQRHALQLPKGDVLFRNQNLQETSQVYYRLVVPWNSPNLQDQDSHLDRRGTSVRVPQTRPEAKVKKPDRDAVLYYGL